MLKLIQEDVDSFAKRAEVYYKKRPQLILMVEDFYRTHRSLAERYDQLKSENRNHLLRTWSSPLSFTKFKLEKTLSLNEEAYDSYSEVDESEVDDPEGEKTVGDRIESDEYTILREELKRLREKNKVQEEQLMEKDEEKREVIRQLSLAMDLLREENLKLEKCISEQCTPEFNMFDDNIIEKLFNGFSKGQNTS